LLLKDSSLLSTWSTNDPISVVARKGETADDAQTLYEADHGPLHDDTFFIVRILMAEPS
jgi:hypothetical protein